MSGGGKDPNKAAMKQQKRQMKRLGAIDLPELEEFLLQSPELVGLLDAEELGDSAFDKLQEDEGLRQAQMDALRRLQEEGEVGITPEERAQRNAMLRESAAQNQAQQKQILQSMAQRGNLDSGASLIAQLQANAQQGADARRQSEQMAADVAGRRRQALMQAGSMAGGMSAEDFRRQATAASAQDEIARFNAAQRANVQQQNLAARQAIENQKAALANQQQIYNKELLQQYYQNQMDKARTMAGVESTGATNKANALLSQGQAQAGMYTGIASGIAGAAGAYGKYLADKENKG